MKKHKYEGLQVSAIAETRKLGICILLCPAHPGQATV